MMEPTAPQTIAEFFTRTVADRKDESALGFIRDGKLHWRTWREVAHDVASLAAEIRAAGIEPGDRVANVSENRYEWIITDLALHLADAVHVPIHVTLSGEQITEQITHCGAKLAFVSSEELLAKFATRLDHQIPFWLHDDRPTTAPTPTSAFPATHIPHPASSSLATILYTSGTTGRPRGVMLSHANLASNAAATADAFGDHQHETRLCILPLSHIYARTCDLYTWVYRGSQLVVAENRETLARDLQLVRPTAINAVPYIYQRIAEQIRAAGGDETANLRSFFGGNIEMLNCGGAPLAPEIEAWYASHGMPVLIGYGLTETSPVIAVSTPRANRAGAVGRPLPKVEVRIAEDGEILARGPNMMLGYWRDEAATAEISRDGWLQTGDLGALDEDGFLFIRGRKKEMIVLSTGKKVTPTRVELLLTASPLIDQAAVFGDNLSGLIALVVPSACGLGPSPEHATTHARFTTEINRCLQSAAHEEQVHRFELLDRPFSIEHGELTAKLSLCRSVIARSFAIELNRLQMKESQPASAASKMLESEF